jgi:hypothetical protein
MMPLWALELAEEFWRRVGAVEPFPRRLRGPLESGAFDVTLKEIARLSVHKVENRLAFAGVQYRSGEPDRPLRACVAAHGGAAWVFLDADDPPDEKTASIAHETAHYLRHCYQPRCRAAALGEGLLAVADGLRAATPAEEVNALLRRVNLAIHVHYLHREGDRLLPAVRNAEDEADLLAWQLLAPVEAVLARAGAEDEMPQVVALLGRAFGLPESMATQYADWLCPEDDVGPAVNAIGKFLNACRDGRGARE